MEKVLIEKFQKAIALLYAQSQEALQAQDVGAYSKVRDLVRVLKSQCREFIQLSTMDKIQSIIKKLKHNALLNDEELKIIRLWIIGDASSYIELENSCEDWVKEIERLLVEVKKFETENIDEKKAAQLQALLLDLDRNFSDVSYYLDTKERIKKFEKATESIDANEAKLLADTLTNYLQSAGM